MKQMMGMVIIAGFLVVTADLEAVERRLDRVRTKDGPTPKIVLTTGRQLLAVADDGTPPPGQMAAGGPPLPLAPAPALFRCVKYRDRHHIAPCAVPMCVAVRDPCDRHDRCSCGPPKCVLVEICVPPCGSPRIACKHDGAKVRYDYGRYAVNITSRHGVVVVNYDR